MTNSGRWDSSRNLNAPMWWNLPAGRQVADKFYARMAELVDASASKADDLYGHGSSILPPGKCFNVLPSWWNW